MIRLPRLEIHQLYGQFNAPVTEFDCGERCSPDNPSGKPFCCDICHAVPAAYRQEWVYLQTHTDLWHEWIGNECPQDPGDPQALRADTPESMLLLACLGPDQCQRAYRALSCRQFPFFPYITSDLRFIGLAYEWEFEQVCWVIRNLEWVTDTYRQEFVRFFDFLFAEWPEELKGYALKSEELRDFFSSRRRRFPLLQRGGGIYLVSPNSERMRR